MVSRRYCKVNNKFLDDVGWNKPDSYIMYFDSNNLYGRAMAHPLTVGNSNG